MKIKNAAIREILDKLSTAVASRAA
jgi:hypothetical protein